MAGVLILIGWRFRIKPPGLFALYVAFYTFGRTFEELLRVDPSHHFARRAAELLGLAGRLRARRSVLRLVAVLPRGRRADGGAAAARDAGDRRGRRWRSRRAASARAASLRRVHVRELELDLDAFEGPFDLLLTLVLREELEPRDVDVADVVRHVRRAPGRAGASSISTRAGSSSCSSARCSS